MRVVGLVLQQHGGRRLVKIQTSGSVVQSALQLSGFSTVKIIIKNEKKKKKTKGSNAKNYVSMCVCVCLSVARTNLVTKKIKIIIIINTLSPVRLFLFKFFGRRRRWSSAQQQQPTTNTTTTKISV